MEPRLVLRGWGGELLRRDASVASKRKRKKRLIRLQVHPYGDSLTGLITLRKKLQEVLAIIFIMRCVFGSNRPSLIVILNSICIAAYTALMNWFDVNSTKRQPEAQVYAFNAPRVLRMQSCFHSIMCLCRFFPAGTD